MGGQLSFFSVDARPLGVADLAGVLCARGAAAGFGSGGSARLLVELGEHWRAKALIVECEQRGVQLELHEPVEDGPLRLRTAFRADLAELAARWSDGERKTVPAGLELDGGMLRCWAIAAGRWMGSGYQLGLDPQAPHTHEPLRAALYRAGLPATPLGPRSGGAPALQISGSRRRGRLAELVGEAPADREWPP